jgi:hypothetical protein
MYKYFIATEAGGPRDVVWEGGDNRSFVADDSAADVVQLNDGPFRVRTACSVSLSAGSDTVQYPSWATPLWRGAGVVVPVFALRTRRSLGSGEFSDIKVCVAAIT